MKLTYQDDLFKKDDKKAHAGSPQYDRHAPRRPTPKTNPLQRQKEEQPVLMDNSQYLLKNIDEALKEPADKFI